MSASGLQRFPLSGKLPESCCSTKARLKRQYDFRLGKTTIDTIRPVLNVAADAAKGVTQDRHLCVLVIFDVKNAFNTVPWPGIDAACSKISLPIYIRHMIRSYLSDRYVLVPIDGQLSRRKMTCGVPQGSVLGPTLWNIFYDDLLRLKLPADASMIGFADDLALLVVNHTTKGLEVITNEALSLISNWTIGNGMALTHQKTEAVMLTRKWAYRQPVVFFSGGHPVVIKRAVKYLGVMLDSKLTFTTHIKAVAAATVNSAKAIGRLMPKIGGPSTAKRSLLASVVVSRLLNAAPVWSVVPTTLIER